MKKGLLYVLFIAFYSHLQVFAQQSVSIGTTNTNPSAVLWLNSPGQNQALIIPVVSNVSAVASPVAGMVVYDQSANAMYYRSATAWVLLGGAVTVTAGAGIDISGSTITNTGDTNPADDITTATPATGDLSGTYPAPTVAKLRGVGLSATSPTASQVLQYNGTNWTPATLTVGSGTVTSAGLTMPSMFNVTGSPITTAGTIGITMAAQAAGTVLAAPAAATGTPSFRQLAASDITSGTLPLANGGTGATAATAARTNLGLGALATLSTITNTEITDGTIINADISTTAAIAGAKISPNFGTQNITTTGALNTATLNATGAVTLSALAGTGTRMVTTDATGALGSQTIPTTFSTLNVVPKGDGTALTASSIFDNGNVGIGTTTPYNRLSILGPNASATGGHQSFFTTADAHPTLQFMNWGHGDVGIYFDAYLSTGNNFTSSNATSNFAIHKASALDFQYESAVAAGGAISWSNALSILNTGNVTHTNFTRLGSSGPAIKTVKLTGTTSSSSGGSTSVMLTGIPMSKILSVYPSVQYVTTAAVPSNYTINPTYEFQHYFYEISGDTYIVIWNKSGNDGSLLGKPYTVYVTYEQ